MASVTLLGKEIELDKQFNIELEGEVSVTNTGRNAIRHLLQAKLGLKTTLPMDWDWRPVVQKGSYRGKFANRVSAFFQKHYDLKLDKALIEEIGNLAAAHMSKPLFIIADITADLTWAAGEFGDGQSCFWGSKASAREVMMYHNGLAIRFYHDSMPEKGRARAWLAPNVPNENSLVIFNGYGIPGDPTLDFAMTLARWLKTDYRRVNLSVMKSTSNIVFINNGGTGYLLGNNAALGDRSAIDLRWHDKFPKCVSCMKRALPDTDVMATMLGGRYYCPEHWASNVTECPHCHNQRIDKYDGPYNLFQNDGHRSRVCEECHNAAVQCEGCEHRFEDNNRVVAIGPVRWGRVDVRNQMDLCIDCVARLAVCEDCGMRHTSNGNDGPAVCSVCAETRARVAREEKERVYRAKIEQRRLALRAARAAAMESGEVDDVVTREFLSSEGSLVITDAQGTIIDRSKIEIP